MISVQPGSGTWRFGNPTCQFDLSLKFDFFFFSFLISVKDGLYIYRLEAHHVWYNMQEAILSNLVMDHVLS